MDSQNSTRMTAEYREFIMNRMNGTVRSKAEARRVVLNGARMKTEEKAHAYISRKMSFPSYYGNNLDALYDMLCTISEPVEITIKNTSRLRQRLGDYAEALLKTFADAESKNSNVDYIEIE